MNQIIRFAPIPPFAPETLAERWDCSTETIRHLVKSGRLRGFRLGRMLMIPADAMEEYECKTTGSDVSKDASSLLSSSQIAPVDGIVLTHSRPRKPRAQPLTQSEEKPLPKDANTVADLWAGCIDHLADRPAATTLKYTGKAVLPHFGIFRPDHVTV